MRGIDSLDPRDDSIAEIVSGGVTTVYSGPGSANIIGGTGFAMKLRGRTVEEMVIPGTEAMRMALGENPKRCYGRDKKVMPYTRMGNAAVLREALTKARRIHAHRADDILTAVRVAEEFNLAFIIEHATEGYLIADVLADGG